MNNLKLMKFVDGNYSTEVKVSLEDDTVWMSTKEIAELYERTVSNINKHIKNILHSNTVNSKSVIEDFSHTCVDLSKNLPIIGEDDKPYNIVHYNLDMILEIGRICRSNRGEVEGGTIYKDYLYMPPLNRKYEKTLYNLILH